MIPTHSIVIIGAGQIGSRHLQALKKVRVPLEITVIDPSEQSLAIAKQRYAEMPAGKHPHVINYFQKIPCNQNIDLAIIATTSSMRANVIKKLLKKNRVRYFLLEKILFDKKSDYQAMEKVFSKSKIKAWVNFPTRIRPSFKKIKKELLDKNISFRVTGSQWGLVTNAIHHLDFVSYLVGSTNYTVNTNFLDKKPTSNKRKGFLELTGTLYANFKNGGQYECTSYAFGNAPHLIEVFNKDTRYIILDLNNAWVSNIKNGWKWKKVYFKTPLISETTTTVVENILKNGNCPLTPYEESIKIHLPLLEALKIFLNKNTKNKFTKYPFT